MYDTEYTLALEENNSDYVNNGYGGVDGDRR